MGIHGGTPSSKGLPLGWAEGLPGRFRFMLIDHG